jgi:tetratricopeptide (TPR) repeat protein
MNRGVKGVPSVESFPWSLPCASPRAALAWVALVSACTAAVPQGKPELPSRPLDLQLPPEAPDETGMNQLPAAWDAEAARAAYRIDTGPLPGAGNFSELDGPPSSQFARNPYLVAEGGDNDRKLATRVPSDQARPFMEEANQAFGAGRLDEAFTAYRAVIERDPLFAKAYFYVAEIESKRHDLDAATAWNDRGLRLSPRDGYGHALRAEIMAASGREDLARASLAYALALDPVSPRAIKLLRQLGGTRLPGIEPPVLVRLLGSAQSVQSQAVQPSSDPAPALAPLGAAAGSGPVLVARGGGHPAWQRYAVCRALLVHDTHIRDQFIQSPVQARWPGTRSLEEETTCGYMATAAYRAQRARGPADADLERWSRAYDSNLLREAVIYETLGCRRPEVLPLLNDDALGRVVEYVRLFVLPPQRAARK